MHHSSSHCTALRLPRRTRLSLLLCTLIGALIGTVQAQELRATVRMEEPQQHFLQVELHLSGFASDQIELALPVWTPGSYKVRDYAQFVERMSAATADGQLLDLRKMGKSRWIIDTDRSDHVVLRYSVFANERSVRQSFLDDTQAFIVPAALLPYVEGHKDLPYVVEIQTPQANWIVDTTMELIGTHTFRAKDYDELVDSPLQVGTQKHYPFEVEGKPLALVVTGDGNLAGAAMAADMAKIVAECAKIFGGLPFERYLFMLRLGRGGGGLEHADCCALMSSAWRFDSKSGWESLLGLVAHEFFHTWNVKRIKDETLGPFDYSKEVYTELLWVHEGWTTYYTPILMQRAGFKTASDLRNAFQSSIASYLRRPGRRVQSLAASSYDAWIKRYQTSATTRNSTVDYYGQGAVAALCLDLIVRHHSAGTRSLDDVLRILWQEYAKVDKPVNPRIVRSALVRLGGPEAQDFWTRHIYGTDEIDFGHYLAYAGLEYELQLDDDKDKDDEDKDKEAQKDGEESKADKQPKPWEQGKLPHLGWSTSTEGRSLVVRSIDRDSVTWRAGFAMGDEILAIGEVRVTSSTWPKLLLRHVEAGSVKVLINRAGRMLHLELPLLGTQPTPKVKKAKEADELARKVYASLFGEPFDGKSATDKKQGKDEKPEDESQ